VAHESISAARDLDREFALRVIVEIARLSNRAANICERNDRVWQALQLFALYFANS
jgi:hypothetical protein